jgi:hypothetical protein
MLAAMIRRQEIEADKTTTGRMEELAEKNGRQHGGDHNVTVSEQGRKACVSQIVELGSKAQMIRR